MGISINRSGHPIAHKSASAFLCGLIALVLLLSFEFTLVLYVRELSFSQYIDTRDLISGSAYVISLVIFWLMPIWLAKGECHEEQKRYLKAEGYSMIQKGKKFVVENYEKYLLKE